MFSFDTAVTLWIVLAILAGVIEMSIPHFGVVFVSAGAIPAALFAALGFDITVQILVFIIALGLSFWLLRPRLVSGMNSPGVPSRTGMLIGREGVVTHDIDPVVGAGRVNVGGEDWAARASQPIGAGRRIKVVAADGIVLEVVPA